MKYAAWFGAVSGVRSMTNVPELVSTTACFGGDCATIVALSVSAPATMMAALKDRPRDGG